MRRRIRAGLASVAVFAVLAAAGTAVALALIALWPS